jgi:trk system potassium uptake protein TrkA
LPGYSIVEIRAPAAFVGKTLSELALRNKLQIQLIAIHRINGTETELKIIPRADDVIQASDQLILLGGERELDRLREFGAQVPAEQER